MTSEKILTNYLENLWNNYSDDNRSTYSSKKEFLEKRLSTALAADVFDQDEDITKEEELYIDNLDRSIVDFGRSKIDPVIMEYAQSLTKEIVEYEKRNSSLASMV